MFADLMLTPGGILSWLVVGLVAGWLAGLFMQGNGYGIIVDIIVGLLGSFIGGLIFSLFVAGDVGFWGSIGVAFIGSCVLVAVFRALTPSRTPNFFFRDAVRFCDYPSLALFASEGFC